MDDVIKPPLGVVPKDIWEHRRQQDLARAIYQYIEQGREPKREWLMELADFYHNKANGNTQRES